MRSAVPNRMTVKVVGANGQISLGKQFAGRQVLVEEQAQGVWLVRTATVVPDNERWLHTAAAASDLDSALAWAAQNAPADVELEKTLTHLSESAHGQQ